MTQSGFPSDSNDFPADATVAAADDLNAALAEAHEYLEERVRGRVVLVL